LPSHGRLLGMAIVMVALGGLFTIGSSTLAVPSWLAAHGYGSPGVFTLTESTGCDRNSPPHQRCGWSGDFVSDDHTVNKHDVDLAGGLPPGAHVGDTIRARASGSQRSVFRDGDTTGWQGDAVLFSISSGILLIGILSTVTLTRHGRRDEPSPA
jgi:hypothetical protein